jgi:hypothetical protein
MSKFTFLLISFLCASVIASAAFVPNKSQIAASTASAKTMSVSEFEAATGKKLNWFQKFQFKRAQKQMAKGKMPAFWDAEELTEGFQVWPFLGSIFTGGILYLVMLFTAKDSNALRWARWGAFVVWLLLAGVTIYGYTQGIF